MGDCSIMKCRSNSSASSLISCTAWANPCSNSDDCKLGYTGVISQCGSVWVVGIVSSSSLFKVVVMQSIVARCVQRQKEDRPKARHGSSLWEMTHVSLRVPGVDIPLSISRRSPGLAPRSTRSYRRMNVTPAPGANSVYETANGFDPQFIELAIT